MALRKQLNPREMDLQPEMRDILMRNGMQAHIIESGGKYQLAVQGHDSPLLFYNLTQKQMLALTDWGTNTANKKAYNVFNSIIGNDFHMPRNFVHARNANGRVAMGLHGYRVGVGELTNEARANGQARLDFALQGGRRPIGQYGRTPKSDAHHMIHRHGMWGRSMLGWTPRHQDGFHLRRVGGQLFYPNMVAERPDGRLKPGELQSGGYGYYWRGQQGQQQVQQPIVQNDVLQQLQTIITPVQQRPRPTEPAKPYKELITSPVYFCNEKWQECLQSHGIIIDYQSKTLTIQSNCTDMDMVYDLKNEELKALTDNSIKSTPLDKRLETLNNVIGADFADKITMDMLNSKERINIALKPEVQEELTRQLQPTEEEQVVAEQQEQVINPENGVDGRDLAALNESKGWYREGKHGREVEVTSITVNPAQAEGKFQMTAVINGETITHEISQKQYDKFLAMDDYHRMKMFSSIFKEVNMKTHPEMRSNIGAKIFGALTAGLVVAGEVAHGIHHIADDDRPHHGHHMGEPPLRVYGKLGVDTPNEIAARMYEAHANQVANDMRRGL